MDVAFADESLAFVETEDAAQTGLPVTVIMWARTQLRLVRAAPDLRSLKNWRSLGYDEGEVLFGRASSIAIPPNWRMFFHLDDHDGRPKFVVTALAASS